MTAFAVVKLCDNANLIGSANSTAYATNVSYNPVGYVQPGLAKWVNRAGGIPVGYPSLTLQSRGPTKDSRLYKVTAKLVLPVLEVTSPSTATGIQPAPTKAYDMTCIMEFIIPERATEEDRKKLLYLAHSSLCDLITKADNTGGEATATPITVAVRNLEVPY